MSFDFCFVYRSKICRTSSAFSSASIFASGISFTHKRTKYKFIQIRFGFRLGVEIAQIKNLISIFSLRMFRDDKEKKRNFYSFVCLEWNTGVFFLCFFFCLSWLKIVLGYAACATTSTRFAAVDRCLRIIM